MAQKVKYQIIFRGLASNRLFLQEFDTVDAFNAAVADVHARNTLNLVFTNVYRDIYEISQITDL